MKLAVIGSRSFDDYYLMSNILNNISITEVVSGGARGADTLAKRYAKSNKLKYTEFLPDWPQFGKKAGMLRNSEIIWYCDTLIAFWDGESLGTSNSIIKAQRANKLYDIVSYNANALYT